MSDTQSAETPMSEHVARFWRHLETETVRVMVDLKRTIGHDAPDGPSVYWDGASFSDDVAKALVAERSEIIATLKEMLFWFGNPRRDEWMNYEAFEKAKAADLNARAVVAKVKA